MSSLFVSIAFTFVLSYRRAGRTYRLDVTDQAAATMIGFLASLRFSLRSHDQQHAHHDQKPVHDAVELPLGDSLAQIDAQQSGADHKGQ